jgi:4-hydroxy-tetrahydrodipicolinate synthase
MFSGIHAILYALFDRDERIDRAAMRRQVEVCLACGVDAVGALGLASEVGKLSEAERELVMAATAEDVAGRAPLYFTIAGNSVAEQTRQAKAAAAAGARWLILQPPATGSGGSELAAFFGRLADATDLPVAIQNAPQYMGRGLTAAEIGALVGAHPNIRLLKAEGSAVEIKAVIEATEGRVAVLGGRGGLEMIDALRAGCAGFVLAPDTIDCAVAAYARWRAGDEGGAQDHYAEALPAIVFLMHSLDTLVCYGKRLFALRAGLEVFDRAPALRPTAFGLALAARHARRLGPLPGGSA